jgi:hypothetical protein
MLSIAMGYPAFAPTPVALVEPAVSELPGQLIGYWFEPGDDVPDARPDHDPTGAVLIAAQAGAGGTSDAMSLTRGPDGLWRPLSHAAVRAYFHSTGMVEGETWTFVVFRAGGGRLVFECLPPLRDAALHETESKFGPEARSRARDDYPTVVFRIRPVDGERLARILR